MSLDDIHQLRNKIWGIYNIVDILFSRTETEEIGGDAFTPDFITLTALLSKENVLLAGPPGMGKSESSSTLLSLVYSLPYETISRGRVQGTPDMTEEQLIATLDLPAYRDGRPRPLWRPQAIQPAIFVDEVNRIPPHLQSELLRILSEGEWVSNGYVINNKPTGVATINRSDIGSWDLSLALQNRLSVYVQISPIDGNTAELQTNPDYTLLRNEILETLRNSELSSRMDEILKRFNTDHVRLRKSLAIAKIKAHQGDLGAVYDTLSKVYDNLPEGITQILDNPLPTEGETLEKLGEHLANALEQFKEYTFEDAKGDIEWVRSEMAKTPIEIPEEILTNYDLNYTTPITPLSPEELMVVQEKIDELPLDTDSVLFINYLAMALNYAGDIPLSDSADNKQMINLSHFSSSYVSKMKLPISPRNISAMVNMSKTISFLLGYESVPVGIVGDMARYCIPPAYLENGSSTRQVGELVSSVLEEFQTVKADYKELKSLISDSEGPDISDEEREELKSGMMDIIRKRRNYSPFMTSLSKSQSDICKEVYSTIEGGN